MATKGHRRSRRKARKTRRLILGALALLALGVGLFFFLNGSEQIDPQEALARGGVLLERGDLPGAVIEFKNALQADPDNAAARLALGNAYLDIPNAPAALKELRRARSLGLNSDALNRGIARAFIGTGEMETAATELALNAKEDSAEWRTIQGLLDFAVGRFEEARNEFTAAVEMDSGNIEAHRALARASIRLGETEQAKAYIKQALELTETDYDVWILKGDLAAHEKDFEAAVNAYNKALEITPKSPLALLQRASVHVALRNFDAALGDLNAIGAASEQDPRAMYLRAVIEREKEQNNSALRYLRQILVLAPSHQASLLLAATIHFEAEEFSQAKDYIDRLLAVNPGNEEVRRMQRAVDLAAGHLNNDIEDLSSVDLNKSTDPALLALLGTAHLKHGNLVDGTLSLERASELAPDSVPIKTQLAFARLRAGNIAEALTELEAIRAEDPDFLLAAVLQAFALAADERTDESFAVVDDVVAKTPDLPVAYNLRGYLYGATGNDVKARQDFTKARELDEKFFPAYFNLARLAMKTKDLDAAKTALQQVLDFEPNHPQALNDLASLNVQQGNAELALQQLQLAREQNPDAIAARISLARLLRTRGEAAKAEEVAEEAYALAPYAPNAQFEYAVIKLFTGDPTSALPSIEALIARLPNSPQPLELHARALEQLGDVEGLETVLTKLVNQFPQHVQGKIALARLYVSKRQFDEARKLADSLVAVAESKALGLDLQGDILYAQSRWSDAVAAYKGAHAENPSSQSVLKVFVAQRRLGGTTKLLDEWLAENPEDDGVRIVKATNQAATGEAEKAIDEYKRVLERTPDNIVVLNNLAYIYDERGDSRAMEFAKRAYELAPARSEVMDTYGWILLRAGNKQQGLNMLTRAARGAPINRDIAYHLAYALHESGDDSAALEQLKKILGDETVFQLRGDASKLLAKLQTQR